MRQVDARDSPRFAQISTFGRLPVTQDLSGVKAAFVGVPFDDGTTYRTGPRFGPSSVRQGSRLLRKYNPFVDVEPFEELNACDYGDANIIPGYIEDTMQVVKRDYVSIASKCVPFTAGGDHSIALPILRAMHEVHGRVNLVHLDSHYDFWDNYWGKKYNHGTWLRRAKEEGLLNEVIQVGIRASLYSKEDIEDSKKLGITYYTTNETKSNPDLIIKHVNSLKGKTYVSFDIDVVDPAFAPGTGTPEVGGLSSYEAIDIMRKFRFENMVGMEVVEVSPPYDVSELTSMLAANLIYEGMSIQAKANR
ncbi:MAG: agmatinase [Nitrososphaerales archaeon]